MSDDKLLERVHIEPTILAGKPVIRGTRLSVDFILGLLAHGATIQEILNEYEGLVQEDVLACLLFAAKSLESAAFLPLKTEVAHHLTSVERSSRSMRA